MPLRPAPADTLEVSLPTACLGTPRWVRLGVQVSGFDLPFGSTAA